MRICIVNEFFYPDSTGGTGAVLSSLARTLHANYEDLEIDVITSRHLYRDASHPLAQYEEWDGIRIFRLATPRPSKTSTIKRLTANCLFGSAALLKLLRLGRYDLILVGTAPPTVAVTASTFKRLTGTPYVYVIYDLEPDRAIAMNVIAADSRFARILKRSQQSWLCAAGKIVVLGRCMRDHLAQNYRISPADIAVIPVGADPEEVLPLNKRSRFRAMHGLDGFIALYAGNFGRYHNFDAILDAARVLRPLRDDITFVLVGSGAQHEHIAHRVKEERLCNVRMFPFVPQKDYADLLASADVSLVTLEPGMEGICVPSKFYSILASGRPTIAMMSPRSEVARVIEEAQCGVQLDQEDSAGLAAALSHFADHPAELEQMSRNARRRLLDRYTANHVAEAYYQTFLEATGRTVRSEAEAALTTPASKIGASH